MFVKISISDNGRRQKAGGQHVAYILEFLLILSIYEFSHEFFISKTFALNKALSFAMRTGKSDKTNKNVVCEKMNPKEKKSNCYLSIKKKVRKRL